MKKFKFGILLGIGSGMTWGLSTVIIGIILTFSVFLDYSKSIFISSLTIVFLNDLYSSIWLLINLIRDKKISEIKSIKSKAGYLLIFASILGGPIGMAGYLMGVKYIGPSYTASFSALYPALGTILTGIILKEKINLRMKIGVVVSGLGILILSYTPVNITMYPHYLLGIFFSFLCVFGWALECVIASYSMRYGEIDPSIAITVRQMTSAIFYAFIIIPTINGYPLVIDIFKDIKVVVIIALTALIGSLSYLFWYKSIDFIGAPRGMALNITYVIWTIIFEKIYFGNELSIKFILAAVVIILGVILISAEPKEIFKKNK